MEQTAESKQTGILTICLLKYDLPLLYHFLSISTFVLPHPYLYPCLLLNQPFILNYTFLSNPRFDAMFPNSGFVMLYVGHLSLAWYQ